MTPDSMIFFSPSKSNTEYVLETLQTNKYTAIKTTNSNNNDAYKRLIL